MPHPLRCCLVGGQSLLVHCAQGLLDAGHQIPGISSSDPAVVEWARSRSIPVLPLDGTLAAHMAAERCDYVFSIANLRIIPASVLAQATRGAINFHDGPLPRYAGLHATTWALLGREATHAITWHFIEGGIDEGRILLQESFDISADETALTLNAKCYEAGMRTFPRLVEGLAAGTLTAIAQDPAHRTYFGASRRPSGACVLDFDREAADVAAFVRALDFGTYPNPLGVPWMATPLGVLRASGIEVLPTRSGASPGTVLDTGQGLDVATRTNDVRLTRLAASDGFELSPSQAAARFQLVRGATLALPPAGVLSRVGEVHERMARHETFWIDRLASRLAIDLPYVCSERLSRQAGALRVADDDGAPSGGDGGRRLAALCLYCARVTRAPRFDVGLSAPGLLAPENLDPWCATTVPMRVDLSHDDDLETAAGKAQAALEETLRHVGYFRDLFLRTPALRAVRGRQRPRWSLRIAVVDALPDSFQPDDRDAALSVYIDRARGTWRWVHDEEAITAESVVTVQQQVRTLAAQLAASPSTRLGRASLMTEAERDRLVRQWNATETAYRTDACVHQLIAEQARLTPERAAIVWRSAPTSFAGLDARANAFAHDLVARGVGPNVTVGVCLPRSPDLMVAVLGVLKAGGAYVPLDPEYPAERLASMLADSGARLLVANRQTGDLLAAAPQERLFVEDARGSAAEAPPTAVTSDDLMYLIYTSGSTGRPKGVMVTHRNVVNLFAGLDQAFSGDRDGVWLALTSLSFDISVLELFWTLARGFSVVLHGGAGHAAARANAGRRRPISFSLFYFASDEGQSPVERYRLLVEGAKFADAHGFEAVWTPERHFHAFGGLYPNPSVASAAIAMITRSVGIRAGSVVLPLHHPARVAEEWAVVDNLSRGRVGISFASGWQPDDFVLNPSAYREAKTLLMRHLDTVRRLWRGEAVSFDGPRGPVEVRTLPRPVQPELPVWVTSAGNPETFRMAGEAGAFVLTHLLGQSIAELTLKLQAYRDAWRAAGHGGEGRVTLMLHTFIGEDERMVREHVRGPMKRYLASSMSLIKGVASTFPAFKTMNTSSPADVDALFASLEPEELDAVTEHAFERYYETGGLFGTVSDAQRIVEELRAIGVDEIACLIDFGVESDAVLDGLRHLDRVRARAAAVDLSVDEAPIGEVIERAGVTHLQCTPSLAAMLVRDPHTRSALAGVKRFLVGGEALPPELAAELCASVGGSVHNMYGPTETTVWSTTWTVEAGARSVAIGRPLANTRLYVLDEAGEPVPTGIPGELFIGGDGVARGYWNQPVLTAERFVPDSFAAHANGRLYRTGDLVRYRTDGTLEFLGRLDHQVKVRGYRMELGEIEHVLAGAAGVRDAVVLRREDRPGDVRLVAYVRRTDASAAVDAEALRTRVRERLPEFMVPAQVVALDAFPLTPNGKIDRKALPPPESVRPVAATSGGAPETDIERTLVRIWTDLLGLPSVGVDENFFDLGGHSLLAVQALARIRDAMAESIPITDLFRFPTIRGLARHLSGAALPSAALEQAQARASKRLAARRRDPREGR